MAHSYRLGLVTWRYQVRIPVGPDICHRGCAYTVLQSVQRHGMYSAAYGTVHYEEPLRSFEIRVGHSPGFGLPSVAILPWLCRKRRKAIIYIQYIYTNKIIFRTCNEIIFRTNEIIFRTNEIILRTNEILFRTNEIISYKRNNISYQRNNISYKRNIISYKRNNISYKRNNISYKRNHFVQTK